MLFSAPTGNGGETLRWLWRYCPLLLLYLSDQSTAHTRWALRFPQVITYSTDHRVRSRGATDLSTATVPSLPSLHRDGVVWAGGAGGGCAAELLLTFQDAIVCLSGFAASLGPQQSVLLSSHIYIDPPPSTASLLPLSILLLLITWEGKALEVADQSSRGGGCLAG